ncbi:MAG: alpha/beta hydrolase [Pirellulaceae bacterium]|nr:alpha/beta hydrolase [Pirellulaceae bacterium]
MPLDPEVKQLLAEMASAGMQNICDMSPTNARQQMRDALSTLGAAEEVDHITDRAVVGPHGDIAVRIYRNDREALVPVLVFFHGGGWVVGDIETHDQYCRALANAADVTVVSVDYRLAPEHPYPAAAEDCYAVTQWASENLELLGGEPGKVAVGGDSAGGDLAAVVALMARDRGGPEIAFQLLIYPITDHDFERPSYHENATGYGLTRQAMMWFWDHYVPQKSERDQAYASPMRANDLADLPPAFIFTAEFDPLRDEAEAYAERLREAGCDVVLKRYDGVIHGFSRRLNQLEKARQALFDSAGQMNRVLRNS